MKAGIEIVFLIYHFEETGVKKLIENQASVYF